MSLPRCSLLSYWILLARCHVTRQLNQGLVGVQDLLTGKRAGSDYLGEFARTLLYCVSTGYYRYGIR